MHIRLKSNKSKVFFINPIHFDEKKHEKLSKKEVSKIVDVQAPEEEAPAEAPAEAPSAEEAAK